MGKKKLKQDDLKRIHRFQSFSERIANIRINVAHKVEHVAESAEERSTYFGEGLAKWRELNCTTDFVTFSRETHHMTGTLPQLVHHTVDIVSKLKHYLQIPHTLAYEPLLDLLVQFARDLQVEFYPYFKEFFPILVSMTDTQDTDVIQCVFTSLAYLFKFLWRYMVRDIESVFTMYSELLGVSVKAHIRQFAVESFGFLLRKVHDHSALFDIIFRQLSDNTDLAEGVGQLLFEMCRGVPKQFHSCTDSVLPLLLKKLGSTQFSSETVFKALSKMMQLMAEHTRKEFAGSLWKPLLSHLSEIRSGVCDGEECDQELSHVLHLIGTLVSWRRGSRVTDLSQVVEVIVGLLSEGSLSHQSLSVAVHLAASIILISSYVPHTHTSLVSLVRGVCGVRVVERWEVELVIEFFRELAEKYQEFEEDILSECLAFCNSTLHSSENKDLILKFLAELCLHFEPPLYSLECGHSPLTDFVLDFDLSSLSKSGSRKSDGQTVPGYLAERVGSWRDYLGIGNEGMEVGGTGMGELWTCVLVLRHIRPCPEEAVPHLLDLYSHLSEVVLTSEVVSESQLLLLSQCLSSLLRIDIGKLLESVPLSGVLELLRKLPSSLPLLSSFEEYLAALSSGDAPESPSTNWLLKFLPALQCNLSSPHSMVRLVTLKALCSFEQLPLITSSEESQGEDHLVADTLEVCLKAEETSTDLNTYRRKNLWLQKLRYSPTLSSLLPDVYKEVPLRYLIGSLYINFSLIWDTVIETISSYATEENMKSFWTLFGGVLEAASDTAEGHQRLSSPSDGSTKWHSSISALFQYWNRSVCGLESSRVDHANFRFLLWKCVSSLNPNMAEPRSRILVPLVLRFVKKEYSLQEDNLMETQDLRKAFSQQAADSSEVVTAEGTSSVLETKTDSSGYRKSVYKTLVAMLTAFSKFKNPKTFYRQEELKQLFMKLLTHKLPEVQKLALSCLMTYKPPHLLPYKENFERLLEDSTFREELMSFSADSSCSVVSPEHREQLLPTLVRLLYGRMQRSGGHESSKTGGSSRQGTVLRFLGSCEERDMVEFIHLITLPFQELKSHRNEYSTVVSMVNPSHVIPLKKQQGFLNLLGQMIATVGPNIKHYLSDLFPIPLQLGACCTALLNQRSVIQPHLVTALKALRQLILGRVSECFDCFLDYDFSKYMEHVFLCLVWPQLPKLPNECVQSPTALLKLLNTWTTHQQYFHLLKTPVPPSVSNGLSIDTACSESSQILDFVYSCLGSAGVSSSVCDYIVQMTLNLLCTESDPPASQHSSTKSLGVELMLPHISKLLEYLKKSIQESFQQAKQGSNLHMNFSLLSKISVFVESRDQSSLLIQLLLSFLTKSFKYKKFEGEILLTLNKLMGQCGEVNYRPFSELFSTMNERKSRASLCDIFVEIARKDSQWQRTASIVSKLNAWDNRRIEEPDYDLRLEGFKEATKMLSSHETGQTSWSHDILETMLPIIHNVLFFLTEAEDMSIRDGAASYISSLIKHVTPHDGEAFKIIILGATLSTVKQGLRSKAEFARHEAISILSQLVKSYPSHWRFSDLAPLCHHEAEADFFENVKHIQLHRRTRAFRKLAAVCAEGGLSQTSCMWFLLPLANQVVFRPSSNTEQNLLGEAVNVIGAISALLSWTNYCFMLTHYLRQLAKQIEIQKSLVKVVVAVLDNFHFDLSMVTSEDVQAIKSHRSGAARPVEPTSSDSSPPVPASDSTEDMATEMECEMENEGAAVEDKRAVDKNKMSARKILKSIVHSILPSLQDVLTKRIDVAGHKLSTLSQNEDSEILRVPIAMAMTKLLLALPEETLHVHLPSLLLKVCQTLKNRSRDVRDVGRSTLVKMAAALGPKYLRYIIKEMKDTLDRGYMLHVLGYSLHSLLRGMTPHLQSGDLDPCLELVSSILTEDLFGVPAEERESGEKVARIPESKTPQSYNCYEIMGTFLSPKLLPDLLEPVKQRLESQCTAHCVHIVEEVFRRVGVGIHANQAFTPQALLVFIHNLLSDSIPQLSCKPKPKVAVTDTYPAARPRDSRLLPPAPQRAGARSVAVSNTGASVTSEFGLQLFHIALKRGKLDTSSEQLLTMVDPFVSLLSNSLSSRHVKVISRALQGLVWLVRLPLPSLPSCVEELSGQLFELLRQYARAGAAVGPNRELVLSAFKAMTVIVRDYKKLTVSEDELKLLLSFVEEDIHDYQRQSTAFPLLKAILVRKLVVSEIYDVMLKVCQLSVTADSDHIQLQCRQAVLMFLMDYPLGKKLNRYLDFYISNLSYEGQSGRESVLEMFSSMFTKFPEKMLQRHSSYFFVPLASQLINDESPTCRQMVAETVKLLLRRLDSSRISDVTSMLDTWIESENLLHKRLGIQVLGLLIEVEGQGFEKRVSTYLPILTDCLSLYGPHSTGEGLTETASTKPVAIREDREDSAASDNEPVLETVTNENTLFNEGSVSDGEGEMDVEEDGEKLQGGESTSKELTGMAAMAALDHLLFTTLSTIHKLVCQCSVLRGSNFASHMTVMWGGVQPLLLHPHVWVRLASCQLYGLLFSAYTPDELVTLATHGPNKKRTRRSKGREEIKSPDYLLDDTLLKVQELSHTFCTQLWSPLLTSDLADQAVKNLVFCAKVLHRFHLTGKVNSAGEHPSNPQSGSGRHGNTRDLAWLVAQLARLAKFEAGHHPKQSQKRTCVLQWTAAVSVDLGEEHLPPYLPSLLAPVYRELSDSSKRAGEELYSLAQEVVDLMKGVCGREAFSRAYAQVHQSATDVREKRRKQAALEAVANPEKSIRRKRKKNELKKAAKKMKILRIRPDSTAAALARRKSKHKH